MFVLSTIGLLSLQWLAVHSNQDPYPCPPNDSLYDRDDLEDIVFGVERHLHTFENLMDSFQPQLDKFVNDSVNDLNNFHINITDQPAHLINITNQISEGRKKLEPLVKKDANLLKQRKPLREKLEEQEAQLDHLNKKFSNIEDICPCNDNNRRKRHAANEDDDYYCGNLKQIKSDSTQFLLNNYEEMRNKVLSYLNESRTKYQHRIDDLKEKVEDVALQSYKHVMYNVLQLQNDYDLYEELLERVDVQSVILSINQSSADAEDKLNNLNNLIEVYRKKCEDCSESGGDVAVRLYGSSHKGHGQGHKAQDLLNRVLQDLVNRQNSLAQEYFGFAYGRLNDKINEIEKEDTNPDNYKPLRDEIAALVEREQRALDELKKQAPPEAFQDLLNINESYNKLNANIDATTKRVQEEIDR